MVFIKSKGRPMKEFTVKETTDFRLVGKKTACLNPEGLFSIELSGECLDDRGEVADRSTYNFFLTQNEIQKLCNNLVQQ
jgi:hypothetical protein